MAGKYGWRPVVWPDSWIEIDLLTNKFIGSIVSLAHTWDNRFVPTFRLQYRSDGSDTWVDYTDYNGNTKTFSANSYPLQPTLHELKPEIEARYVRFYPITYLTSLVTRWEMFSCSNYIHPLVDHLPSSLSALCDNSATNCIKTTDTVNNQIRMQWNGLRASSNVTNIVLSGSSLICSHYFTKVGIEVDSMGCNAEYALCTIEGSGVNGTCHAACKLRDGQVGKPFNLLLMVTGDGAELCDVRMDLSLLPAGRSVIDNMNDWNTLFQEISAN
ncbi:hypothetical protein CAPTEDRAFT_198515 [Capitella teleta]|uniref:F5/8 type C domain-containing protein n=1 Tax=Capitella teleta TaxID=283909 RepID=R7TYT8_CAPTE|nr:hypothetical protein CAPTEDRAFT_198515 [Capitella teleta]|eukprot:ELT98889.1 hypothetical protein CAPTEDRAFT_198515 [Capitella teleta]